MSNHIRKLSASHVLHRFKSTQTKTRAGLGFTLCCGLALGGGTMPRSELAAQEIRPATIFPASTLANIPNGSAALPARSLYEPAGSIIPTEYLTVPPGYPSGYPGASTDEGAPIGRGPSGYSYNVGPQIFAAPPFDDEYTPQTFITPEGVVIDEDPRIPIVRRGPPSDAKDGILQAINATATYLPDLAGDGFSVVDLEHSFTLGFPLPTRESPLLISPGFDIHILSGPDTPDLPSELYDSYLSVRWLRKLSERWMLNVATTPGWYSDWQTSDSNALRVPAQLFFIYDCNPQLKILGGLAYLDRDDVNFLPVAGFIWSPNEDTRWEIVLPRPRYYHRYRQSETFEDWFSISGEFGGGQWAVERASGANDVLTSRDYRLLVGVERKSLNGGIGGRLEIGYVFGRTYEYASDSDNPFEPGSTLVARMGLAY